MKTRSLTAHKLATDVQTLLELLRTLTADKALRDRQSIRCMILRSFARTLRLLILGADGRPAEFYLARSYARSILEVLLQWQDEQVELDRERHQKSMAMARDIIQRLSAMGEPLMDERDMLDLVMLSPMSQLAMSEMWKKYRRESGISNHEES
jgi:hypothetical protein